MDFLLIFQVFGSLVDGLIVEARRSSLVDSSFKKPLMALTQLLEIKVSDEHNVKPGSNTSAGVMPFCRLISETVIYFKTFLNFLFYNSSLTVD